MILIMGVLACELSSLTGLNWDINLDSPGDECDGKHCSTKLSALDLYHGSKQYSKAI